MHKQGRQDRRWKRAAAAAGCRACKAGEECAVGLSVDCKQIRSRGERVMGCREEDRVAGWSCDPRDEAEAPLTSMLVSLQRLSWYKGLGHPLDTTYQSVTLGSGWVEKTKQFNSFLHQPFKVSWAWNPNSRNLVSKSVRQIHTGSTPILQYRHDHNSSSVPAPRHKSQ